MKYKAVIGLEVHVELKTNSKMFCNCSADYFGKKPNTHTCPVCLGLPGALPVPNKAAIEACLKIGMALNCTPSKFSKFDRKNYFYPDLPKGYQISQYDLPFSQEGTIEIKVKDKSKKIGITRVHMEEDTGKLIHSGNDSTLIDFNRSGVPLVEIVTEPDFESAEEVVAYLKKLQQIVRYLGVASADMEKGEMRLEPNISLLKDDQTGLPKYKVEVKNINSFRFVEKAINFELERQQDLLEEGKTPAQETRGFDELKQKTVTQRQKEEANDYRYFPEPDIPPFSFEENYLKKIKGEIPELPDEKLLRLQKEYSLPYYDSEILTRDKNLANLFEEAIKIGKGFDINPKPIANYIINKKINIDTLPAKIIEEIQKEKPEEIPTEELDHIIEKVIMENEKAVNDLKSGKEQAFMFLVGQVMRTAKRKIDTHLVRERINKKIQ
jgi:aspartyl-tRNA(Asn)/glutamyl-tRNA(Gln) amidotransferase subunit B